MQRLGKLIGMFTILTEDKNLQLKIVDNVDLLGNKDVLSDIKRIKQMVYILLANSVKHTHRG